MFRVMVRTVGRWASVEGEGGPQWVRKRHWVTWATHETEAAALDEAYRLRAGGQTCQVVDEDEYHSFCMYNKVA